MKYSQAPPLSLGQFWVVLPDGRGDDHSRGIAQLLGSVPDVDPGSLPFQPAEVLRILTVAAAYLNAVSQHHRGDSVHAGAANGNEMHRSQLVRLWELDGSDQTHQRITSRTFDANTVAASSRATPASA